MSKVTSAPADDPGSDKPDPTRDAKSPFPRTTDSILKQINDASSGDAEAVGRLCVIYRPAILTFVRRWTHRPEDAEDLTHEFLARTIAKNPFAGYERRHCKFRTYLLTVLSNFLRDKYRSKGPESEPLVEEILSEATVVSALDVAIALEMHTQILEALKIKYIGKGMGDRFATLRAFILSIDDRYADLAGPLGMSPGNLRKLMFVLRESYHDRLRDAVSQLVPREDIADEMRYLLGLLAKLPPENRDRERDRGNSNFDDLV